MSSRTLCPICGMPERGVLALNWPHNVTAEFSDPRCTVCDLVGMTSQQVRWADDEALNSIMEGDKRLEAAIARAEKAEAELAQRPEATGL